MSASLLCRVATAAFVSTHPSTSYYPGSLTHHHHQPAIVPASVPAISLSPQQPHATLAPFSPLFTSRRPHHDGNSISSTSTPSSFRRRPSSSQLYAGTGVEAAAIGFFTGIRIPSALIAGSSLGALFSMVEKTKNIKDHNTTTPRVERVLILSYHICSLISLLLSLNVVVTATSAGTALLLSRSSVSTASSSAYAFLKQEMYYEFLTTRWSFFVSLLSFFGVVTTRALLEFDLLTDKRRRKWAAMLLLSVGALVTHVISLINHTLMCFDNMFGMTSAVVKVFFERAIQKQKPLDLISAMMAIGAIIAAMASLWDTLQFSSSSNNNNTANGEEEPFQ